MLKAARLLRGRKRTGRLRALKLGKLTFAGAEGSASFGGITSKCSALRRRQKRSLIHVTNFRAFRAIMGLTIFFDLKNAVSGHRE